jgi:hypothetical protein
MAFHPVGIPEIPQRFRRDQPREAPAKSAMVVSRSAETKIEAVPGRAHIADIPPIAIHVLNLAAYGEHEPLDAGHLVLQRAGWRKPATVLLLTPKNRPATGRLMKRQSFSPCDHGMRSALSNPIDAAIRQVL